MKTGREWMVLLLGLCRETNEKMIETVKEFLEKMWRARCRENECARYCFSSVCVCLFLFSTGVADIKHWPWSDPETPVASRSKSQCYIALQE